jgi:hypothetical protein
MRATTGDQIVVSGRHVGNADRRGTITDVRGHDGAPPYLVRWDDGDGECLFFPGPDCHVEPRRRESSRTGGT